MITVVALRLRSNYWKVDYFYSKNGCMTYDIQNKPTKNKV